MADDQKKLQSLSDAYQKLQTGSPSPSPQPSDTDPNPDLQSVISARQKLESQQQENKGVQKVPLPLPPPFLLSTPLLKLSVGVLQIAHLVEHLQTRRARASETRAQRSRHGC